MTIVSLTEKPISVRNAAIIGRSILNCSIRRNLLHAGDHRQPVGDRDRAQGDEHVVDDRDDRRQAVGERLEPEPEVAGDDDPARDRGDRRPGSASRRRRSRRSSRTARRGGRGRSGRTTASRGQVLGRRRLVEVGPEDRGSPTRSAAVSAARVVTSNRVSGLATPASTRTLRKSVGDLRAGSSARLNLSSYCATAGEPLGAAGLVGLGLAAAAAIGLASPTVSSTRARLEPNASRIAGLTLPSMSFSVVRMLKRTPDALPPTLRLSTVTSGSLASAAFVADAARRAATRSGP